jgi:hypothetical protein
MYIRYSKEEIVVKYYLVVIIIVLLASSIFLNNKETPQKTVEIENIEKEVIPTQTFSEVSKKKEDTNKSTQIKLLEKINENNETNLSAPINIEQNNESNISTMKPLQTIVEDNKTLLSDTNISQINKEKSLNENNQTFLNNQPIKERFVEENINEPEVISFRKEPEKKKEILILKPKQDAIKKDIVDISGMEDTQIKKGNIHIIPQEQLDQMHETITNSGVAFSAKERDEILDEYTKRFSETKMSEEEQKEFLRVRIKAKYILEQLEGLSNEK